MTEVLLTILGGDIVTAPAGQAEFKGLDGCHELFRVSWTPAPGDEVAPRELRSEDAE